MKIQNITRAGMLVAAVAIAGAATSVLFVFAASRQKPPCGNLSDPNCHPSGPVVTTKATQTITGDVNVVGNVNATESICAGIGANQKCLGQSSGGSSVGVSDLKLLKTPIDIAKAFLPEHEKKAKVNIRDMLTFLGNNGRLVRDVTYVSGKIDQAFRFNDDASRVEIPDADSQHVTKWTISLWAHPKVATGAKLVFKEQYGAGGPYSVWWNADGSIVVGVDSWNPGWRGGQWSTSANAVPLNQWTRIDWTYSGNTGSQTDTKVYINGNIVSTTFSDSGYASYSPIYAKIPDTSDPDYNTILPLTIGGSRSNQTFKGLIDDVRLYNRALSSSEVAGLAAGSASPSGLVGHWKGDGNVYDSVGRTTDPGPIQAVLLAAETGNTFSITLSGVCASNEPIDGVEIITAHGDVNSSDVDSNHLLYRIVRGMITAYSYYVYRSGYFCTSLTASTSSFRIQPLNSTSEMWLGYYWNKASDYIRSKSSISPFVSILGYY